MGDLAAGIAAQASCSVLGIGLPVLAPKLCVAAAAYATEFAALLLFLALAGAVPARRRARPRPLAVQESARGA